MKKRIIAVVLTLCLCISAQSVAYAHQEDSLSQDILEEEPDIFEEESTDGLTTYDSTVPTPTEVYEAMIALKDQDGYKEGTTWTDDEPYSDSAGYYQWKGGPLDGKNISAVGCVAFAFTLSDAAFGSLPARMYAENEFTFEDIKIGDILRMNNDTHTVIVLEVSDVGVVVAEGNISSGDQKGKVHWGRAISKETVMRDGSHYITRYPEGYISPDDPEADVSIAAGTLDGGLTWDLTKAGTLTVSGEGAMPDFSSADEQPWSDNGSKVQKVVIADGVTSIGSCAFWNCGVLSVEIAASVASIGNSAFRGSTIISVDIPSSVRIIGDSAFRECQNLSSVTVSEGVEEICQNAFRACTSLTSISLPASLGEVGAGAFFQCTEMKSATFAPGSRQVKLGDNLFTQCYWLLNVTLPSNIDRISDGMFQNCLMLAGVEIPQGAESIGASAFASCSGFTTVIIPDSVTAIDIAAFADCPLTDIYFTGTETQWNSIDKIGDTASTVLKATIHYNYTPGVSPAPDDGDDNNNNDNNNNDNNNDNNNNDNSNSDSDNDNNDSSDSDSDNDNNDSSDSDNDNDDNDDNSNSDNSNDNDNSDDNGDNTIGGDSGSDISNNTGFDNEKAKSEPMASSVINSGIRAAAKVWEPTTPDEIKRYACMGKDAVQCTRSKDNAYWISIENAMQGPMCFQSFEAVLGEYTIGRTYNIYPLSNTAYSMDKEVQFTIKIPSAIYRDDREYKMICVTKDGQPIVYNDLDSSPETITIKTNKFYAYALVYK